ncbi:polyphosphate kinase 2 [Maribacter sp. CXY002]|uniref:polyphosphate kinase 2 n=1 Tax=Maribacter luteocoastalis TaxID=3407671 RepID=UPI003B685B76
MKKDKYTKEEMDLFNSIIGLHTLLKRKNNNPDKALEEIKYLTVLREKQEELIKLQNWVIDNDEKVVILFEGRDAAGKGGAIRRITEYINPRHFRKVALNKPTEDESKQWFFQRYINQLPKPGEIVFFDRSWYNRAVVEPVNGFCTEKEYETFMRHVNDFERMLIDANIHLVKFYFSINKEEQAIRFKDIKSNPLKRWKMTPVDERAQELWDEYTKYKERMFEATHTEIAPWLIIHANNKSSARLKAVSHLLEVVPYK